jgi:hypothetical protein
MLVLRRPLTLRRPPVGVTLLPGQLLLLQAHLLLLMVLLLVMLLLRALLTARPVPRREIPLKSWLRQEALELLGLVQVQQGLRRRMRPISVVVLLAQMSLTS